MRYAFTFVLLMLLATNLAASMKFVREEPISGDWDGLLLRDDLSGELICGVRKLVRDSAGNTARIFFTTHGDAIAPNGKRVRYDFRIGPTRSARLKIDDNAQHRINNSVVDNRKRLVNELKKGKKATIVWQDYLKVETSIFSLAGFSKAYDTAKEWCDGDGIPPVITLVGEPSINIEIGTNYTDVGATASDNNDGDISSKIESSSAVNTNVVGSYSITYSVSDAAGNAATPVVRTVNVTADVTPPVITLLGSTLVNIELGSAYVDAGVTASDNIDGYISNRIESISNVNTNTVGSYSVTYNARDAAGNAATPVVRTVNVTADMTPPVIALKGYPSVGFELGQIYDDAGATGTDNADGDISASIVSTSNVDTNVVGSYSVTYSLSDAAGNSATPVTRTVNVTADKTPPVITLVGYPSVGIETGTNYVDAGATARDNIDGDISSSILVTNSVNTTARGDYSVTFSVSDAAGNAATPVVRTVNVTADMTPPLITLEGYPFVGIETGTDYVDAGATASDNIDGDISSSIEVKNNVNATVVGSYRITYNARDAAGNVATPVVRTVNVTADNTVNAENLVDVGTTDVTPSSSSLIEAQVIRDEIISGGWSGIKMKNISTGTEICGVKTQVETSGGSTVEVFLSTHGEGITSEGDKNRYDFAVGSSMDSNIKVDNKKSHQVTQHLLADREKLVKQFKQGREAKISWQEASQDETFTLSLTGFTRSYDTAKGWCD